MRNIKWLLFLVLVALAATSFASKINRITLSELQTKADLIVLAKITKLVKEENLDCVTIRVDSYLKGNSPQKDYIFTLVTRGGLKDFDPFLRKGDTGVFFLKIKKREGEVEKAYWGSIATFQKNHFDLSDERTNPSKMDTSDYLYEKIDFKEVYSKLIIRDRADNIYSGQVKSQKGFTEFLQKYPIDLNIENIDFEKQMLIFGITDNISTRAFQFLKDKKRNAFVLDYYDTGVKLYKLMPPGEGKQYFYLQVFLVNRIKNISHVKVKNRIRGLSKVYE